IDDTDIAIIGCGESTEPVPVDPGTHTVTEVVESGRTLTSSCGCGCAADGTVQIAEGEDLTCVVTNTLVEAPTTLTVQKECEGTTEGQFEITIDDTDIAIIGCGESTEPVPVDPGTHTVTERAEERRAGPQPFTGGWRPLFTPS